MKSHVLLILAPLLLADVAMATKEPAKTEFIEERVNQYENSYFEKLKKKRQEQDAQEIASGSLIQSSANRYLKFHNRVRVPGYISSSPIPELARVIGPVDSNVNQKRMGDTLYIRWAGAPLPRPGDRYATYTPAVVLQNMQDPTDFQVSLKPKDFSHIPKEFRLAGYFYETTGRLRVTRVKNGLVEALVEQLSGQVAVGDELMPIPPLLENITKIESGLQLSAAVVCGSPFDRLSTTNRSFIYINRGSRDGIRVGRILESIENINLEQGTAGMAPQRSNGEAVVIHTTDSYSTAMIVKEFDVIRIGSLLRTKQESDPLEPISPFGGYQNNVAKENRDILPEVPNPTDALTPAAPGTDTSEMTLPEPDQAADRRENLAPSLSDLDAMEKNLKLKDLSGDEKTRLEKLSRQEKIGVKDEDDEDADIMPTAPSVGSPLAKDGKKAKKDGKKKRAQKNEEEELNLLMMQN